MYRLRAENVELGWGAWIVGWRGDAEVQYGEAVEDGTR